MSRKLKRIDKEPEQEWLTTRELSLRLNAHPDTVRAWARAGCPYKRKNLRDFVFNLAEVEAWVQQHQSKLLGTTWPAARHKRAKALARGKKVPGAPGTKTAFVLSMPKATPKEIIRAASKKGLQISTSLVHNVRWIKRQEP